MSVHVGVDGGGTKTHVVARSADGSLVLDTLLPACSYTILGLQGLQEVLVRARDEVLAAVEGRQDIVWALGLPGHGDDVERSGALERAARSPFASHRYRLFNDVELAHAGALEGRAGVVVASGTGSIALGIDDEGRRARAGGWGPTFGDEGSAYAIAVAALRHVGQVLDGRARPTELSRLVLRDLDVQRADDASTRLTAMASAGRAAIAALARTVDQSAEQGDPLAERILSAAGRDLAGLARAVIGALAMPPDTGIAFTGGTFSSRSLREAFVGHLRRAGLTRVLLAANNPAEGGVLLAKALADG